jgi:pimeloyl-[acyl-carrier protein] methyl ester esterase
MKITTTGQGPNLVLIHGWSMHSGIWHEFGEQLAQYFTLHMVDLPGHGNSEWQQGDFEAVRLIDEFAARLPAEASYLGWSLGGLIAALFSSRHPQRVNKLVMLAASPCFTQKPGWPCAMDEKVFTTFADSLESNQAETLQRFILLQARGAEQSKQTIWSLSEDMAAKVAHSEALRAGLDMLINCDVRQQLAELTMPVKLILAERDTLIPHTMAEEIKSFNPQIKTVQIKGAGHAPFISHPQICFDEVMSFLKDERIHG